MPSEAPIPHEYANYRWLVFDPTRGAPFKIALPILDPSMPALLKEKTTLLPFSRWTIGRKSNPNYTLAGSGLEGHLCALDPMTVRDTLTGFENDAFRIVKQDVGTRSLDRFLDDPRQSISYKMLGSMRVAFEIILAKARAIRAMINKGGYTYNQKGEFVDLRRQPDRINRSRTYENFVYSAPPALDWTVFPVENGILALNQEIARLPTGIPVAQEGLGADIGLNPNLKLLAELGRFGHPAIPMILDSL